MFPVDSYFDPSAKLLLPERIMSPRDLLARKYLSSYDLQLDLALRPHLSKRLIEEDRLTRARISSQNLRLRAAHSPTYMDETIRKNYRSVDSISRSQLEEKLEELTLKLIQHCNQRCSVNLQQLTEMITRNSQQRADRDKASLDIIRELHNSQFNELERQLHSLEEKVHQQFNTLMEEIAMSGRSVIQLKDEVQRLSETENSLLRELNIKAQPKLETAGTNNSSMHFSVVVEEQPSPNQVDSDLVRRVTELEEEMKQTLDRLSIHNNRLGMLTQRIDECKQNNLNTLLDFKQSITYKLDTAEKRERKQYINLFNTLNDCATRARGNQMQLQAVIEKLNCFQGRIIDKSSSLCLSQSLKDRRRAQSPRFNQVNEEQMTDSVLFKRSDRSGSDELSMPPSLMKVISTEVDDGYKTPLKKVSEVKSGEQNQDSLEQIDQSK